MKKLAAFGALVLALGMTSCKTYCPAYNYGKVETQAKPDVSTTASIATEKANS